MGIRLIFRNRRTPAAVGDEWTLDTSMMKPCDYVVLLQVRDRSPAADKNSIITLLRRRVLAEEVADYGGKTEMPGRMASIQPVLRKDKV